MGKDEQLKLLEELADAWEQQSWLSKTKLKHRTRKAIQEIYKYIKEKDSQGE